MAVVVPVRQSVVVATNRLFGPISLLLVRLLCSTSQLIFTNIVRTVFVDNVDRNT
jgi:hypothetical protein